MLNKKNFFKKPVSGEVVDIDGLEDVVIMAVESSCDETACAIVRNGREVLSNIVASQIKTHKVFGGVVPEVAAREHLESVNLVIQEAFEQAGLAPSDIDAFASTVGPGLVGSLLVGLNATKAMAISHDKPFIGVNHLFAHICANYIETPLEPPFVAVLISGGHTQLIEVKSHNEFNIIGETLDDAVGEAYDKVARLLGLPYPGGVYLDKLAQTGNPKAFHLPKAKVSEYDFSFSGLKTAVLHLVQKLQKEFDVIPKADVAASFQECVSVTLLKKALNLANNLDTKTMVLAGGVAANSEIRKKFFELEKSGFKIYAPALKYCTDNASMVASCAYFQTGITTDIDVEVFSRL